MSQKGSLIEHFLLRDVLIEDLISSSNFEHNIIVCELDNVFCRANKVNLALDMDDWNGDIVNIDQLFHILLAIVVSTFLGHERDWSSLEKLLALHVEIDT